MSEESPLSTPAPEKTEAPRRRGRPRTVRAPAPAADTAAPAEPAPAAIPDSPPPPRRTRAAPKADAPEAPPEPRSPHAPERAPERERAPEPAAQHTPPLEDRPREEAPVSREGREARDPREYREPRFSRPDRGDPEDSARRRRRRGRTPLPTNGRPERDYNRPSHRSVSAGDDVQSDGYPKDGPLLKLYELQSLSMPQLLAKAGDMQIPEASSLRRSDLIKEIVYSNSRRNGPVMARGVLEVMPDGFGFLRSPLNTFQPSPEDVMIPPPILRRYNLCPGDVLEGELRSPKPKERFFGFCRLESINGAALSAPRGGHEPFENMIPVFPQQRLILERIENPSISMRVLDLLAPMGKGQRGLLVAPPRAGATRILQDIAISIQANHPEIKLFVLLIDARPEEITHLQRETRAQVIASAYGEPAERQVHVAEFVLDMARRQVELGKDVVILLDSLTRLTRAYNALQLKNGRISTGDVDENALQRAKHFFGAARKVENGGSLTILATATVDTLSARDQLICEAFKGSANLELFLDPVLVEKHLYPALHIARSGARNEELLMHPEELQRVRSLRKALLANSPVEAMELLVSRLKKTKTNPEFLLTLQLS